MPSISGLREHASRRAAPCAFLVGVSMGIIKVSGCHNLSAIVFEKWLDHFSNKCSSDGVTEWWLNVWCFFALVLWFILL